MSYLKIKFARHYKLEVDSDNPEVFDVLTSSLQTETTSTFMVYPKNGGKPFLKSDTKSVKAYKKSGKKLYIDAGLYEYLLNSLKDIPNYKTLALDMSLPDLQEARLAEKWEKIFLSHPKGESLGKSQIDTFSRLARFYGGIADLYTGFGKTEVLLSLIESLNLPSVILVPSNSIRDEILFRAKKWEVEIGDKDWNKKVNVINPVGFLRSKAFDSEAKKWLSKVELVITDECFPFYTKILLDEEGNWVYIGEIYENPYITHVLSYDTKTRSFVKKKIVRKIKSPYNKHLPSVIVDNDPEPIKLLATPNHKVYTKTRGMVRLDALNTTDIVINILDSYKSRQFICSYCGSSHSNSRSFSAQGIEKSYTVIDTFIRNHSSSVIGLCKCRGGRPSQYVYNLEVEDTHTYVADGVVVSNCHHLVAKSWNTMFDHMPKVQRSYGFSASPDVQEGSVLAPGHSKLSELGPHNLKVVGLAGSVRIKKSLPVEVELIRIYTNISDLGAVKSGENWIQLLSEYTEHFKLAQIIKQVVETYTTKFYIPVQKKISGMILYENLTKLGVKVCYWDTDILTPKNFNDLAKNKLECIKKAAENNLFDVLISTSVGFEGVDIPSLGGVIPLIGTSHRMVIQPTGRSARGTRVIIVLIYDKNNPVVLSQMRSRRNRIESNYNVVKKIQLSW